MTDEARLKRLEELVSPFGVVSHVARRRPPRGLPELELFGAHAGAFLVSKQASASHGIIGSGHRLGPGADPRLIAVAEAAERYSARSFIGDMTPLLSAGKLRGAVLDLAAIPRCSERELAHERCPLKRFDADAPMRWIQGVDLATGTTTWVPAVMACYGIGDKCPGEQFWYGISTGYAVHTDPVEALVRGICEVIERDMIALTWLQRLPLPSVAGQCESELLTRLLDWNTRHFRETYLLDATSDLGVPTVYCLQIAEYDERYRQAVACATGRTITSAAEHAVLEASRVVLGNDEDELVEDFAVFSKITDGARYMGRPELAAAFDFLLDGAKIVATGAPATAIPEDPSEALSVLIDSLSAKGMQAVAVDRTSRELAAAGLSACVVVIPQLQPMTLLPLAQYRAHPRLYQAPELMGYRSLTEEELNPWPQPFA